MFVPLLIGYSIFGIVILRMCCIQFYYVQAARFADGRALSPEEGTRAGWGGKYIDLRAIISGTKPAAHPY